MMQLDMTAYTTEGKEPVVGLMQDYVDPALTAFVAKLIDTYANIGWTGTRCGYACRSVLF
jgi:leucyl aminopeptidase